jgi:hypothetical protein
MRNKVLLNVFLPATQKSYEFRVPLDLSIEEGSRLISRILSSRDAVRYASSEDVDLMMLDGESAGAVLSPLESFKWYVEHNQLVDGSSLALM